MSEFLQNRIEIMPNSEPPPANGNRFAPKYMPYPGYPAGLNVFTYYNPYIGRRIAVNFGSAIVPQYNDNTLEAIAVDHYIQLNKINELPQYKSIAGIYHKLNEHNYFSTKNSNMIRNVKMHYNIANQANVDIIASIALQYLEDPKYIPETVNDKVILHAIKLAMRHKRSQLKGGKRKTRRSKHLSRKMRTKRKNI